MSELLATEWLVEQLRNGKELNEELINQAKEFELNKINKKNIEIKDYDPEVHLLFMAIQSVGIKCDYLTCDLLNSTLEVLKKLKGAMTIKDISKIKAEHEKKWNLFFETKQDNKK